MQTAHATQLDGDNGKSNWIVRDSSGKQDLFELDKSMTEKQVMAAIHMARKFELIAYDKGTLDQLGVSRVEMDGVMKRGQSQIDELNNRIAGLSSELLRLMEEEVE